MLDDTAGVTAPGTPDALRRAAAVEVEARGLEGRERESEQTVARYLRNELPRAAPAAPRQPDEVRAAAMAAAAELRAAGNEPPLIVATFPGFHANPFSVLMEQAYASHGLAAIHVASTSEIQAVVDGRETGGYRAVLHVNGPDRFLQDTRASTEAEALAAAEASSSSSTRGWRMACSSSRPSTTGRCSGTAAPRPSAAWPRRSWIGRASSTCSPHRRRPRSMGGSTSPPRGVSTSRTRTTTRRSARPATARRPAAGSTWRRTTRREVLVGLIGSLYGRKGAIALVEAFTAVPDPLSDGRRARLLLAGSLAANGEALIRASCDDARIITRFGYVPDEELPGLLAALDVAVVPYGQYLNSGWLNLALTAGIPAIAPAGGTAAEVVRPEALRTFDPQIPGSLTGALADAPSLATPEARAAARASVADLDAATMSARFVEALLEATSGTVRT